MYGPIRSKIVEVIDEQSTKIQEVHRTDRSQFEGYPVAIVSPSDNEADYSETAPGSDRETYVFIVRIHYPFEIDGQEEADLKLEEALDELLAIFRDRRVLGVAADWVQPVPSVWGYQDRNEGKARVAEMKLRVVKYFQ